MTPHRALNVTLAIAAIVGGIALMQRADEISNAMHATASAQDARLAAVKARREEMARIEFCLKSQGPATFPMEMEDGSFRCKTKRGKDAGPVQVAQQ